MWSIRPTADSTAVRLGLARDAPAKARIVEVPAHRSTTGAVGCASVREYTLSPCVGRGCASLSSMTWKLDPAEVRLGGSGYSSAPVTKGPTRHGGTPARREFTVRLTHIPTGLTVEKTAVGPFTRARAKEAKGAAARRALRAFESKV